MSDEQQQQQQKHLAASEAYLAAWRREHPYWMTKHHLDSYDHFVSTGVQHILTKMDAVQLTKTMQIGSSSAAVPVIITIVFGRKRGVRVAAPPSVLPSEARERDLTYSIELKVDVEIDVNIGGSSTRTVQFDDDISLGKIPLMLHSQSCLLRDQPPDVLRAMGECPHDKGGYFIIDGAEKTLVAREDLVQNRLYVRPADSVTPELSHIGYLQGASHEDTFPRTTTFYVRTTQTISIVVTHISKTRTRGGSGGSRDGVPICVIFRALGIDSDLDILRHIVLDVHSPEEQDVIEFFRASLVDAARLGVMDQASAIKFLTPMVESQWTLKHVLMRDLFPNSGPGFATKALFLGRAVRQLVGTVLGKLEPLDRDDYANKRLTVSGNLLADLFRDVLLRVRKQWVRRLEGEWTSGAWRGAAAGGGDPMRLVTAKNLRGLFESPYLSERLRKSMKGSWGADDEPSDDMTEADNAANGALVQDLSRVSYLSMMSHMRRVNNPLDRSVKMVAPHTLRASHWGAVCPADTPDGPNIGLVSHLATTARITIGTDQTWEAVTAAVVAKVTSLERVSSQGADKLRELHDQCKVFVDDTWLGVTDDPRALLTHLKSLRRSGAFGPLSHEVSLSWRIVEREMHVLTDRGRVLRPLAVVPHLNGMPTLPLPLWSSSEDTRKGGAKERQKREKQREQKKADDGATDDDEAEPPAELVDVEELRTRLVAMYPNDVAKKSHSHRYTHCELVPARAMLSVNAMTIPMIEYNMAARAVLALAQLKQAIGVYSTAFRKRIDTTAYVMHDPQLPIVTTRGAHELWDGMHGNGEHLIVAVCTYCGYNVEDALILNKGSIDRGRFGLTYYATHRFEESAEEDRVISFGIPVDSTKVKDVDAFKHLEGDGLPRVGAHVRPGEVLVGRISTPIATNANANGKGTKDIKDMSVRATTKMCGVVDRVVSYAASRPWQRSSSSAGARERAIKVRLRHVRRPELGDKLASRFSQKGVVGMILPEVDMPYCGTSGIVPDLIFNPHSMPTRNTPSHLMETLLGKAAACAGVQRYDATAFERTDPIGEAVARLEALGMERHGHEVLYSGMTGQAMACDIFVGVNYYGRLKHMVADKLQFRTADGPINAITHQPTKAIGGGSGGLRIGEMERDAVYSHGMATFLQESFTVRSDAKRGFESRVNVDAGGRLATDSVSSAVLDGGPSQRAHVRLPRAFNLLQQELQAMSIDARLDVEVLTDSADAMAEDAADADADDLANEGGKSSDEEDDEDASAATSGNNNDEDDEDIEDDPEVDPAEENDGGRYEWDE